MMNRMMKRSKNKKKTAAHKSINNNELVNENFCINYRRGNVINQMPYETGYPKCRTFGMNDSQKYPGLCKPYEVEKNAGNDYAELAFNSIISQPSPPSYYTYKTLNGEYDGKVDRSVVGLISNNDNVQPSAPRIQVYNANPSNNLAAYSYNKRQGVAIAAPSQNQHQQKQTQYNHQQQRQQNYRPILPSSTSTTKTTTTTTRRTTATNSVLQRQQQTNHYQLSPYQQQRAPSIKQQQTHYQEKRTFDKNDPIHQMAMRTYRWDLLFKKNHL